LYIELDDMHCKDALPKIM